MGLNLETLIGILVILILLIVADGLRRMWRDRHSRLRMRIDPRFRDLPDEPDHNPELGGPARVIRADDEFEDDEYTPDSDQPTELDSATTDAEEPVPVPPPAEDVVPSPPSAPPVVMESATRVRAEKPPEPAQQVDLFSDVGEARKAPALGDLDAAAEAVDDTVEAEASAPAAEPAPAGDLLEVIVVHLVASQGEAFAGRELLSGLLEQGMRYGEMNIFHLHQRGAAGDQLLFSMANAMEPGTFDIDRMEKETFRGVTFFLKLPGPTSASDALNRMLTVARNLATNLSGELRDEQRSVLTRQTEEHLRQRVQDFERRARVARSG